MCVWIKIIIIIIILITRYFLNNIVVVWLEEKLQYSAYFNGHGDETRESWKLILKKVIMFFLCDN